MGRTVRAARASALLVFVLVAALGVFLEFPVFPVILTAAVLAILSAALILAAARRAGTLEVPTDDYDDEPSGGSSG